MDLVQDYAVSVCYPERKKVQKAWVNNDNDAFFDHFTLIVHDECLFNAGLATNKDLIFIQKLIVKAKNILEIGAGYGRIVKGIKNINPCVRVDAIEKSSLIFDTLKKFEDVKGVALYNQDVFNFFDTCQERYDLVLLLWSTLAVFSPSEQFKLLKQLRNYLSADCKVVIDFFLRAEGDLKPHTLDNYYQVDTDQTSHFGYLCPKKRLKQMSEMIGYSCVSFYEYAADQGVVRQIAILEN